jgi:hypothetical protein
LMDIKIYIYVVLFHRYFTSQKMDCLLSIINLPLKYTIQIYKLVYKRSD